MVDIWVVHDEWYEMHGTESNWTFSFSCKDFEKSVYVWMEYPQLSVSFTASWKSISFAWHITLLDMMSELMNFFANTLNYTNGLYEYFVLSKSMVIWAGSLTNICTLVYKLERLEKVTLICMNDYCRKWNNSPPFILW